MHIAACSRPIWWCTGALRARTYDRLGDEPGALLLRPAGDRRLERGQVSTIGRRRENVHWFVPLTSRAATFDVIVTGLEPTGPEYQVLAVDPLGAADLGEGTLRAPLLAASSHASSAVAAAPEDLTIRLDEGTHVETVDDYDHGISLTNFTGGSVTIEAAGTEAATVAKSA